MLREILGEPEKLEEREKFAKLLSSLIFPLWIILLFFTPFLYSMADRVYELQDMFKMRSALEETITFMNYQIINVVLGSVLGIMIFLSIILAERPSLLNKLGGILFGVSSVFDGLMAFELYQVKEIYNGILEKFVLLTSDDLSRYMDQISLHYDKIMLYNRLSAIFIGLAFVFFGIDSMRYPIKIKEALPKAYPGGIVMGGSSFEMMRALNMIKKGASRIEIAGLLFLISGVLDILFGIFSSGEFANTAFIMFLIGLFLESSGTKLVKEGYAKVLLTEQTVLISPTTGEQGENNTYERDNLT